MKTIVGMILIMALAGSALADINVRYDWTAPVTGSEAVQYQVQTIRAGEDWTAYALTATNSILIAVPDGIKDFQTRVAGIDLLGRQGPWSAPSDPYSDDGPPGMPGLPQLIGAVLAILGVFLVLLFYRKEK